MRSIAIWYKPRNDGDADRVRCDIHVNLWLEMSQQSTDGSRASRPISQSPFIDIGIMVYDISKVQNIHINFPITVYQSDVSDLGRLLDNHEVVESIFNENLSVTKDAHPKQTYIKTDDGSESFYIYSLSNNDYEVKSEFSGSTININTNSITPQDDENKRYYFRIRISAKELEEHITKTYTPSDSPFQSAFSVTKIVNFRYNDVRSLNRDLLEHMRSAPFQKFAVKKFMFLCMIPENVDIISDGYDSERELEDESWNTYLTFKPGTAILAYFWKKKSKHPDAPENENIESNLIFFKLRIKKCDHSTIIRYIIYFILINIVSMIIYDAGKSLGGLIYTAFKAMLKSKG